MGFDVRGSMGSKRNAILLSALLLSACASFRPTGAEQEHRQTVPAAQPAPQPAAPPKPDAGEAQQPAPADQGAPPAQKRKHNVEED